MILGFLTDKLLRRVIAFLLVVGLTTIGLALDVTSVKAGPAADIVKEFQQPNGTTLKLHLWGDEFANGYETLDGFTVIQNRSTGFWEYAELDESGRLVPSGVRVDLGEPPVKPFLRPKRPIIE